MVDRGDRSSEPGDGNSANPWRCEDAFVIQRRVGKRQYVNVPSEVRKAIETHVIKKGNTGPGFHWNHYEAGDYVLLSKEPLADDAYTHVAKVIVSQADLDDKHESSRMSVPDGVNVVVDSNFTPGMRVNYLARQDMVTRSNPRVFLLTNRQLFDLLPVDPDAYDEDDPRHALVNNPGFLPQL